MRTLSPYWKYRKFIQYQEYFIKQFKKKAEKRFRKHDFIWSLSIFFVFLSLFFQFKSFHISPIFSFNILTIIAIAWGIRKHLRLQKQTKSYVSDFEQTLSQLKEMPDSQSSMEDMIYTYNDKLNSLYKKYFHT